MSWYSDREPFDEYDLPWCKERCPNGCADFDKCRRCIKERDIEENEDYYRECEEEWW